MAFWTLLKSISWFSLFWLASVWSIVEAHPLESGPGIEVIPAAFSEDDTPKYVVVDEGKVSNTNDLQQSVVTVPEVQQPQNVQYNVQLPVTQAPQIIQYQQPVTQPPQVIQYQQPATQQSQYQYVQPQPMYQQPSGYYQPQPQTVQYPGPASTPYYGAPPPGYSPYGSAQPGPVYPTPIGERGGFLSSFAGPSSGSRYSPFSGSLPSGLSTGATLLGAALL
ncbi:DNA translocase FtsK-like [Anopheles maculipalpis]|uniref:DNA translocase FtsK-like n=1 Tax=Anopheles maculipalpis TaxID=1496333 RepID=UPI00215928A4|nr:DNA translocase FtsK-like [Anopheles maculipalpis]